jgi:hypothetical protein
MALGELQIILVNGQKTRTQHEKELERARIMSHVSKVGHKRRRHRPVCRHGNRLQCEVCTAPKIQHGTYPGSLTRRDPFAATVAHDLPNYVHEAVTYGKSHDESLLQLQL